MDDRLIRRGDGEAGRRIRSAAKLLARLGFVISAVTLAPQLRAAGRAGRDIDWTFAAPALACFGAGLVVLCVFWARDALRARNAGQGQ